MGPTALKGLIQRRREARGHRTYKDRSACSALPGVGAAAMYEAGALMAPSARGLCAKLGVFGAEVCSGGCDPAGGRGARPDDGLTSTIVLGDADPDDGTGARGGGGGGSSTSPAGGRVGVLAAGGPGGAGAGADVSVAARGYRPSSLKNWMYGSSSGFGASAGAAGLAAGVVGSGGASVATSGGVWLADRVGVAGAAA